MMTRDAGGPQGAPGFPRVPDGERLSRAATFRASSYDKDKHSVEAVLSSGARVARWGWQEELRIDADAVDLSRAAAGVMPLLDSHNQYDLGAVLGRVENVRIEGGQLIGTLIFDEGARDIEAKVARGTLRSVSIGYAVQSWELVERNADGGEVWTASRWELLEASLVSVPADPAAGVRSAADVTPEPTTPDEEGAMPEKTENGASALEAGAEQRAVPQTPTGATAAQRLALADRARELNVQDEPSVRAALTNDAATEDAIFATLGRAVAARQAAAPVQSNVRVTQDAGEVKAKRLTDAIVAELTGKSAADTPEHAREFRGLGMADLVQEFTGENKRMRSAADREATIRTAFNTRSFHTASDFPMLLENALNLSLSDRYLAATPVYRSIARQRSYQDFRDHTTVKAGDFPRMSEVNATTGEIVAGTVGEARERTRVRPYGVQLRIARELLVNDRLGGLAQVIADQGNAVSRFEETTAWNVILASSGAGPTLLETSRAVFNTTDGTLAAAAAAITTTSLGVGRAAMRKMKSINGEDIDATPATLVVGPDKETEALQILTATTIVAATTNVSVYAGSLRLLVTPRITGNSWYLFADPGVGANFEWGLLDGYTAPRMRMDEPFGLQGVAYSLEHDFGFGAIDYRFGFRNAGA